MSVTLPAMPAAQPLRAGIGLRHPHCAELLATLPPLGFVEVHSENYFASGGAALQLLHAAREHYPVSLHGVGLALGSAAGVDGWHLDRLATLVQRIAPARVSDHACFARAAVAAVGTGAAVLHGNDLLPLSFNAASLNILCDNVARVQDRLQRRMLVENLSAYLSFDDDVMPEPDFLSALCARTGCGLLLDVNNLMVNALNVGADYPLAHCCAFVDALPRGIVGEIHLAGHCVVNQAGSAPLVIDDHGSRVRPEVWRVYAHALQRFGAVPTLVEWDTDLPPLAVLLDEADQASMLLAALA